MKIATDTDAAALMLRRHITSEAQNNMPSAVQLSVFDGSNQFTTGYVWAKYGTQIVQCLAPGPIDLTGATTANNIVVWALPPNPADAAGFFIMIGSAISGSTSSRAPALMTTGVTIAGGGGGAGGGTVTSVNVAVPSPFTVSGGPVTSSGTITIAMPTQSANIVYAGPTSGGAAAPAFRSLVAADIPSLDAGKITSGTLAIARGGTNLGSYTTGDILYASNTNVLSALAKGTAGWFLSIGASVPAWAQVFYQTVQKAASSVTQRALLNFIDGTNVTITVADNAGTGATDVTIASTGGGADATAEFLAWRGLK